MAPLAVSRKEAVEAGSQTAWPHEVLVERHAQMTVLNPTMVELTAEHRRKTDQIDAKAFCNPHRTDGLSVCFRRRSPA